MAARGPRIEVRYSQADEGEPPPLEREVQRILRAALPATAEVAVNFITAAASQELNHRYLRKDRPANVLAFPAENGGVAGDIAICPAVVADEAEQCAVPAAARYAHLLVHAALHLRGMDHGDPAAAARMEQRESAILAGLGLADPWRGEERA